MLNLHAPARLPGRVLVRRARPAATMLLLLVAAARTAGAASEVRAAAGRPASVVTTTTVSVEAEALLDTEALAEPADPIPVPPPPPPPPPADPAYWAEPIAAAAQSAGLAPELVSAVVEAESAYRADAVSRAGAIGLMQLMPATAAELGVDPHDPVQNLAGGSRYLASMLQRFGRLDLALAAYNAGPGRVARVGGVPAIAETQGYVSKILTRLGHPPVP